MSAHSSEEALKRVIVLEDEPQLAKTLSYALKHLSLDATIVTTLKQAQEQILKIRPDLLILDRMVPDGDGLSICKWLRQQKLDNEPMILVLSAKGTAEERILGLDAGADDYLPKPFNFDELASRIKALARRYRKNTPTIAPAEPNELWSVNPDNLKILGPKGWISVTQLELKLLSKFFSHPREVISRDDLLKDVWGFQWLPKTRTVDFFMTRVRKNFEIDPNNPKHFITVRGVGYRFDP